MITAIEFLCDNNTCRKKGPMLTHAFVVKRDEYHLPMIIVECPKCHQQLEHVFCGGAQARRFDGRDEIQGIRKFQ